MKQGTFHRTSIALFSLQPTISIIFGSNALAQQKPLLTEIAHFQKVVITKISFENKNLVKSNITANIPPARNKNIK